MAKEMEQLSWHIEKRRVKDLIGYKSNPRQISKDQLRQLKRSIEKFDYVEIAAIQPDNTIIAGHMRIKALMQLGWKDREIDVRVPSRPLTEEEMREYLIRSNKNTGEWDFDLLSSDFDLNDLVEWGFTASDFDISPSFENEEKKNKSKKCPHCGEEI